MVRTLEAAMAQYVWQHDLKGERDRLRLMSDLLDPSSRFHLERIGVVAGWCCLEIGAGNGSLSQWLAQRVGPTGHVIATDIRPDLMAGGIREVADKLKSEGGVSRATLDEFLKLCGDPSYWTTTIAFTATTARRPN
jgi:2-polyprenyl-3-methyl-5-hydroxy-6-metoxy-1,4-benzoquinol methylase